MKIRLLSRIHFLVKFNPFNLERKFIEKNEVDFIKILGGQCIPHELLEFINQKEIFIKLNKLSLKYTTANDIRVDKHVKRSLTIYLMKKFNQASILVSLQLLKQSKKMLKL